MKSQLKLILVGLGLVFVASIFLNWRFNRALKEERQRVSYYYDLFKSVENQKDSLQDHTDSIQVILNKYKYLVDSLEVVLENSYDKLKWFDKELNKALAEIKTYTDDQNYQFLQRRYPTEDSLKYGFAGNQLRGIVNDVTLGDYNDSLLEYHIDIALLQQKQLGYKNEIIKTLEKENVDLNALAMRLYDQVATLTNDSQLKDEQIVKLKKALRLWQAGALTGGAFVVLVLLLV